MYGVELYAAVRLAVGDEGLSHHEAGRRFQRCPRRNRSVFRLSRIGGASFAPSCRRRSHPPDGPQHPADDVRFLGEAGIGRIVRVGGDQPQLGRPGLAHRLDPLDHEAIAVPQHGHLAGRGDTPGGVDDERGRSAPGCRTHKHPKVVAWLERHPRFVFHFTPTSCSWLNAVETFFAKLSKRRLKRGVFHSIVNLQTAINRFIAETNDDPTPFVWTANPNKIVAAVKRGHQALDSIH